MWLRVFFCFTGAFEEVGGSWCLRPKVEVLNASGNCDSVVCFRFTHTHSQNTLSNGECSNQELASKTSSAFSHFHNLMHTQTWNCSSWRRVWPVAWLSVRWEVINYWLAGSAKHCSSTKWFTTKDAGINIEARQVHRIQGSPALIPWFWMKTRSGRDFQYCLW